MRGSIWPFLFGERYQTTGGKDEEEQTIQKRTEPAFIEPMQCKPVTALPAKLSNDGRRQLRSFDRWRAASGRSWSGSERTRRRERFTL